MYFQKTQNWASNEEQCVKFLQLSHKLCISSLEAAKDCKENEKMLVLSQLSSAKLTAQGCVKVATNNQYESCKELIQEISELLDQIVTRIKELK